GSTELSKERFAAADRGHWGIENGLHWVLDAIMNGDYCQIYWGNAVEIMACMRHMAQNMLCAESSKKASTRRKQKIAAMSSSYLEKVFWMASILWMKSEHSCSHPASCTLCNNVYEVMISPLIK
ncbi:transposase, partial [Photobacterium damselae]